MSLHPSLVNLNEKGGWLLNLPAELEEHQGELEHLLHKVFARDIKLTRSAQLRNLALAQQMTLNWCIRKRRQIEASV
jgi:hypothetical protein